MSPFAELASESKSGKPEICVIDADDLLSRPVEVTHLDLAWVGLDEIQSITSRRFTCIESAEPQLYQGVALWFDCAFDLPAERVVLSTCPRSSPTHWKQTVIVLPTSVPVEEGDIVGWQLRLDQSAHNHRHYQIQLDLLDPDVEEHPVPCDCGQVKCVIIAAYLAKEDEELRASGADVVDISWIPRQSINANKWIWTHRAFPSMAD